MTVQRNFWVAFSIFVGCIALDQYFHQIFLQRLGILLGTSMVIGFIWAEFSLHGIRFIRSSKHLRYNSGEVLEETYTLFNESRFPKLWIHVEDESSFIAKPASRAITLFTGKSSLFFQSMIVLSIRGEYALGPTRLISGDPFGFFVKQSIFEPLNSILVLPFSFPLEADWNPKGDLSGGKAHRELKSRTSINATSVREYKPGDALNKIHWKSSIRTQKWMVKEFEQDPLANVWIVLDGDADNHYSDINELKPEILFPKDANRYESLQGLPKASFEYAVCIAATLVDYFYRLGRGVGLIFEGNKKITIIPEKGNRQREKLLESLAFIQPESDSSLAGVLKSHFSRISKGNSMILISSCLDDELVRSMNTLAQKGIITRLVYIDPVSFMDNEHRSTVKKIPEYTGFPMQTVLFGDDLNKFLTSFLLDS